MCRARLTYMQRAFAVHGITHVCISCSMDCLFSKPLPLLTTSLLPAAPFPRSRYSGPAFPPWAQQMGMFSREGSWPEETSSPASSDRKCQIATRFQVSLQEPCTTLPSRGLPAIKHYMVTKVESPLLSPVSDKDYDSVLNLIELIPRECKNSTVARYPRVIVCPVYNRTQSGASSDQDASKVATELRTIWNVPV